MPLQKMPKNGEDWGKLIVAKGFKIAQSPKYRPIWSHCSDINLLFSFILPKLKLPR